MRAGRHADRAVVLLRAIDAVGELCVGREMVELRGQLVVNSGESLSAVVAYARAAVVAFDHASRIARVNPEVVVVAVRGIHLCPRLAAVNRLPRAVVEHPRGVGVLGVGEYVLVVPGASLQVAVVGDELPSVAVVV